MRLRLAFLIGLVFLGFPCAGAKVFVFYPSLARPLAIQDALAKTCPNLDITVFGRLTDLQALVDKEHPQAIVAQNAVLRQFPDYKPRLQGTRNGAVTETYVLLSVDKPFNLAQASTSVIGVVGMLDRKEMGDFVQNLVPGATRLNRVTKVEDLLPLLIFRSAAAVMVSEANMQEFRKKSQANLVSVKLEKAGVGLVAAGIRQAEGGDAASAAPVLPALRALDPGSLSLLGVDAWK